MWGRIYPHTVLLIFANIILKASCKGNGSLTFVIDDTGSMHDDINQVVKNVNRISNIVFNEKSSLIGNMVLVTFNDPGATVRTATDNRTTFRRTLEAVYADGGGDCPEPSMKGLLLALETSNRDSYIYVFTDASAKDYGDGHLVKQMCQRKQSQIIFVITGHCRHSYYNDPSFDVYFDIANACSGQAFVVSKDDVDQVTQTIDVAIKGKKNDIAREMIPAFEKKRIPFTIDDHTDYAIVSVSGKNVYLDIQGPSADQEKIMWNDNAKVVKLSNAKPGTYEATVQGQTKTSVVIVGRTDFFFTHGFSQQIPKSLSDTSLQPIADSNVHLSISVTDDHHSVDIKSVQILNMHGKPIKNRLPLTKISKDFYVTNQFVAPSERFKVAVNGIVIATGKPIQRIGKIPVTPQEPPIKLPDNTKPIVKIAEGKTIEIEYNSTVKLTCNVVAFPEPKIEWANKRGRIMPSNMSLVETPYKYISYMDISYASKGDTSTYKCYAANDVGRDEKTIEVIVKDPFTVKAAPSGITKLVYGTEGTITCDVKSHLPMDIHWVYANEITGQAKEIVTSDKYELSGSRTQLKIKMMDFDLVGRYSCKVSLKNKKDVEKSFITRVKIDGIKPPKLSGAATNNVRLGTQASIQCIIIEGLPKPSITWQYMASSASEFAPFPGFGTTLHITNVEKKHAGRYKCVARNKLGSDEHITTLIVEYSPVIITKSTKVEGIEGDLALKIPCDVVGVPKPTITWKIKGTKITPGAKYSIEDGALFIMNPTEKDTSSYTCEAKNHISSVSVTFEVKVDKLPKNFGKVHHVYLKEGETKKLKCEAYNSKSQTVKWFITQDAGNKEYIKIGNASPYEHDGNYTCHVSDKHGNTQTHTYVVDVGIAPEFYSNDDSIRNWRGKVNEIIEFCDVRAKPKPMVQWTFNGKALTELDLAGVGHYTCTVSNVHGSVQKKFDVKSSVCLITRNLRDAQYMPLVLNYEGSWHDFETTNHYMIVVKERPITLSCPTQKGTSNTFRNFPKNSILKAICDKEDSYLVEDKIYKLSDLQCTSSIQPSVIKNKVKCLTETSELISVGYYVSRFLEAYEVCFDYKKNMPIFSRIIMTDGNNNGLNTGYNWYPYPGIGNKQTEKAFTCKDTSSTCCYSKSQLVNAIDFNDGPAKKSTFIDPLNLIPVWIPCGTSEWSWEDINDKVRSQLSDYGDIVVWSGTHTWQEKNGATIPRYLWKVVRLTDEEVLAIIHVNDPNPTASDIKCKSPDICNIYEDWTVNGTSTYCCSLPDFLKSFDIHVTDIGETMDMVLHKIHNTSI